MIRRRQPAQLNRVDVCLCLAIDLAPQLATALCRMPLVEKPGLGTFAVDDHGRIYVDPLMIALATEDPSEGQWTIRQAAWVLIHEAWHFLREHADRSLRWYELWSDLPALVVAEVLNKYQDVEINADLLAEGATLPPGQFPATVGLPDTWSGLFEAILQKPDPPPPSDSAGSSGDPDPSDAGGNPRQGIPQGVGGSGTHGIPMPWELAEAGDPSSPEKQAATRGLTRDEATSLRDAVAAAVLEAAKHRGNLPAGMLRWADGRLRPPAVDWRREIRAAVSVGCTLARGSDDYSYSRPSRRGTFHGVIMPRLVRPVPEVAIVADTSGSMSAEDLLLVLSEVEGVVRSLGQSAVRIASCDADASGWQKIQRAREAKLIGGGGTDMRVGIAAALAIGARVIVVLTDGGTPWPEQRPRHARVIAGMVGHERGSFPSHPAWLHCVAIPKSEVAA